MVKAEGTETRSRIEVLKDHYVVKEDAKSVVWREGRFHHLIEKAQIVESGRRSDEGLADRVKADISRTKECAESIPWEAAPEDAKKTSGRRRCDRPAGKVTGLKIAVGDEVCFWRIELCPARAS